MAGNQLMEQLKKKYGVKAGTKIYLTIVPGILADFKKMLKSTQPDEVVRETYHFEDGDGAIAVTGSKSAAGEIKIEASLVTEG